MSGTFPFGRPVQTLKQTDCSPKDVFILGVYASAVHAKWLDPQGKIVVRALAIASEPYIFWRGENAEQHFPSIPKDVGTLVEPDKQFNGPSGIALDELIIEPMGYRRQDCWLCDLVPHSCVNPSQQKAIVRKYNPMMAKYGLPKPSVPPVPTELTNQKRRDEIYEALVQSKATKLVTLGDKPIQWFTKYYDMRWERLSDFLKDGKRYGEPVKSIIGDLAVELIPLAHPRQIAMLGQSSAIWGKRHDEWLQLN